MNYIDYIVIAAYVIGFLLLGRLFRNNQNTDDYFLGGKSFGWFPLSMSTIATQLSAISFISAPAFVGLKPNGGMQWLTYEFAVPLAMIFLMVFLIPPMYKAGIVSVYAYLEKRFDSSTRVLLSGVFQISRAFATSVMIYTVALILSEVLGVQMWLTIAIIGIVTLIYSYQGGMKAVVYGDMLQMFILFAGIVICLVAGIQNLGGWDEFLSNLDRDRLQAVDFSSMGLQTGDEFGFWPMLLGGFFLYASYYGTDQSQVQRLFSAQDMGTVKKTLLFNGLLRFPVTFIYCIMGLVIGTLVLQDVAFREAIPAGKPDLMIPIFIRDYLPHGLIGILMVAILSAAMSSLSSAINSLSAASIEDFFNRQQKLPVKKHLAYSKYAALFWGIVCIVLAFFTGDIADTVIEAINKVGSVFYGPILATFVAAIGIRSVNARGINAGILAGVLVNVYLWQFVPEVFWFWWNAIGAGVTLLTAVLVSRFSPTTRQHDDNAAAMRADHRISLLSSDKAYLVILILFFVGIVVVSTLVPKIF